MRPLFPLKSKKVGVIRDSDLLAIARKIDEVTRRAKGADPTGKSPKSEETPDDSPQAAADTPADEQEAG